MGFERPSFPALHKRILDFSICRKKILDSPLERDGWVRSSDKVEQILAVVIVIGLALEPLPEENLAGEMVVRKNTTAGLASSPEKSLPED